MSYNQELKKLMDRKEITQKQLADLTGLGKSSISQYISGKNEPSERNKKILMNALEVEADFLEESESMPYEYGNVPIETAAKLMGKSKQFIRVGLQQGVFEFGYAVKMIGRYSYHISPKKFYEYIGMKLK
ncbi:helix-turn-helix domain-containing protein [Carnobacterium pleistocenium]|uniref:helix-turn-helix domain-containing protein n=1 Tax=Carnobacterium pleistocenium TaxID=181073 RepID=UPI000A004D00|nr:helix-turn-helix transcriptional regulator [Carnobacterium pleistocenium]